MTLCELSKYLGSQNWHSSHVIISRAKPARPSIYHEKAFNHRSNSTDSMILIVPTQPLPLVVCCNLANTTTHISIGNKLHCVGGKPTVGTNSVIPFVPTHGKHHSRLFQSGNKLHWQQIIVLQPPWVSWRMNRASNLHQDVLWKEQSLMVRFFTGRSENDKDRQTPQAIRRTPQAIQPANRQHL